MDCETIGQFCEKIALLLGASGCRSFSGRLESIVALCDALELGAKDCVYVSALTPSVVVKALLSCGVVPVFCDITPDSMTMDHHALEAAVRHTISNEQLYPRAVIADNFCGMPFSARAVRNVCDRMGLILIEDCGECFGGTSDGVLCGSVGDYSLMSLGASSLFGTGGTGCVTAVFHGEPFEQKLAACDGWGYQTADESYAPALLRAFDGRESVLTESRRLAAVITDILSESDFWVQRGSGRQKSSFGGMAVIAQDEAQCTAAVDSFVTAGLGRYVEHVHVHRRACFERGCRGFKETENAAALAPRAFTLNLFGAIHAGRSDALLAQLQKTAKVTSD